MTGPGTPALERPGAVEWIDEPLGRGVRASSLRLFRVCCLAFAGITVAVGLLAFVARWPEILAWVLLGAAAVLLGLALRFSRTELPDKLGLGLDDLVVTTASGAESRVAYSSVLGVEHAVGAGETARVRYRVGPRGTKGVRELLLDRKVADRVMARVSAR